MTNHKDALGAAVHAFYYAPAHSMKDCIESACLAYQQALARPSAAEDDNAAKLRAGADWLERHCPSEDTIAIAIRMVKAAGEIEALRAARPVEAPVPVAGNELVERRPGGELVEKIQAIREAIETARGMHHNSEQWRNEGEEYTPTGQVLDDWINDLWDSALRSAASDRPGEWRPISEAPKDGTKIDLLFPDPRGRTIDCFWDEIGPGWFWRTPTWENGELLPESKWNMSCYPNMEPTHWQPLPSPPSGSER